MKNLNRWLIVAIVALVTADWASKLWLIKQVPLGQTHSLLDGWLYFAHRQNTGVAFSMFAELPQSWGAPLLSLVTLFSLGLFVWMLRTTPDVWSRIPLALIIAGAIGNLGDRVVNGSVTDFILVSFFPYVFNVADAAITVGGIALGLRLLFGPKPEEEAAPEAVRG
jgi:signal peptidase II